MILFGDQLIEKTQVQIDIEDRAYQFGDGVYEVIRVYNGQPFYLKEHLIRLEKSAQAIRLPLPYSINKIQSLLQQLLEKSSTAEGKIYLQISRGTAPRNHAFPPNAKPLLVAYFDTIDRPLSKLQHGISAITTADLRWLRCDIKSLNLLPAVLAKQEAVDQGCEEALLVRDEKITEGSSSNVFFVQQGKLITHPSNHLILHGITRQITIDLANQLKVPIVYQALSQQQLEHIDECFITSTTVEICPVVQIDGKAVGNGQPGPITRQLQQAFDALIPDANNV
jgi:D-alanine transaminase